MPGKGGGGGAEELRLEDGLREPGGGGGFLPIGGGGPLEEAVETEEGGLGASLRPVFLRLATAGLDAAEPGSGGRPPGIGGAAPPGGFGADIPGGLGTARDPVSGSER